MEMEQAFQAYLAEEEAVLGIRAEDLQKTYPSLPPRFDFTADVAPLPPEIHAITGWQPGNNHSRGCSDCASSCSCGTSNRATVAI
jgi:hypothetical protein